MMGEKRDYVIIIVRQCVQVARGTGAIVTTLKAGEKAIINITSTGTCTTCVEITTAESECKSIRGCDTTSSVGIISNHIRLSKGTCMSSRSRWCDDVGTTTYVASGARGCAVRSTCSAMHEACSRGHGLASLTARWWSCAVQGEV